MRDFRDRLQDILDAIAQIEVEQVKGEIETIRSCGPIIWPEAVSCAQTLAWSQADKSKPSRSSAINNELSRINPTGP